MDKSTFPDLIHKYNELLKTQALLFNDETITITLPSNIFDLYCEEICKYNGPFVTIKMFYDISTKHVELYLPHGCVTLLKGF